MIKKRLFSFAMIMMLAASALTGCGGSSSSEADSGAYTNGAYAAKSMAAESAVASYDDADYAEEYEESGDYNSGAYGSGEVTSDTQVDESAANANSNRKLIRNINMTVETLEYETLITGIKSKVNQLGGYFESIDESRNTYSASEVRYANLTIRVPKENADALIAVVEKDSNIVDRSENISDVTLDYVDKESHKKALQAEQQRLLELMEKAETIEDLITIESRLSDVRYQIESMESQLRTYDNKIEYTTMYLTIREVEKITPAEEPGFFQRISEGFVESLDGARRIIENLVVWFVVNIPYLILLAVFVLIVIFLIVRPIAKKSKAASDKRRQEYQEFALKKAAAAGGVPVDKLIDKTLPEPVKTERKHGWKKNAPEKTEETKAEEPKTEDPLAKTDKN